MRYDVPRLRFRVKAERVKHDPAPHVGDVTLQIGESHDLTVDGLLEARHDLDLLPGSLVTCDYPGPVGWRVELGQQWVHDADFLNALSWDCIALAKVE